MSDISDCETGELDYQACRDLIALILLQALKDVGSRSSLRRLEAVEFLHSRDAAAYCDLLGIQRAAMLQCVSDLVREAA